MASPHDQVRAASFFPLLRSALLIRRPTRDTDKLISYRSEQGLCIH